MPSNGATGIVFNIQRFSIHDGPGIRTTVFLKGCALRCGWCHNPEGLDPLPVVSLLPERCIACDACLAACLLEIAESLDSARKRVRPPEVRCGRCGACADACPSGARTLVGRLYGVDQLMVELDKDRVFYSESGGGVTFSGGEPLMPYNAGFLIESLSACAERGYHRVVDTSGHALRSTVLAVAAQADLFLYDLKFIDPEAHRKYVGVDNRLILDNLKALAAAGSNLWVRVPLIPGISDRRENIEGIAEFVARLDRLPPVHILPYHRIGGDKYRRIGLAYGLEELQAPAGPDIELAASILRAHGLEVH
ncbi:MAG: glycyl-radical enzyme activating protein [Acidobacteria bacterium]|nr:glycyl-radical enzyme activating protein [Acidobacteriota bacterium]